MITSSSVSEKIVWRTVNPAIPGIHRLMTIIALWAVAFFVLLGSVGLAIFFVIPCVMSYKKLKGQLNQLPRSPFTQSPGSAFARAHTPPPVLDLGQGGDEGELPSSVGRLFSQYRGSLPSFTQMPPRSAQRAGSQGSPYSHLKGEKERAQRNALYQGMHTYIHDKISDLYTTCCLPLRLAAPKDVSHFQNQYTAFFQGLCNNLEWMSLADSLPYHFVKEVRSIHRTIIGEWEEEMKLLWEEGFPAAHLELLLRACFANTTQENEKELNEWRALCLKSDSLKNCLMVKKNDPFNKKALQLYEGGLPCL